MKQQTTTTGKSMNRIQRRAARALLAAGILWSAAAGAATNNWVSSESYALWLSDANWSAGIPGATDEVFVANSRAAVVEGATVATASNLTISSGSQVIIGNVDPGALAVVNTITLGTVSSSGTLQLNYGTLSFNTLSVGSNGSYSDTANGTLVLTGADPTIKMAGGVTVLINSTITGTNGLIKGGLGTLTIAGNSTYSGGTTINTGTLKIGNGGTTGSLGSGDVTNNASLIFNRSNTMIVNNFITGTGSITQAGSGTTILTANNTYSGGTTISAGTLQIGNGGTTGWLGSGDILDNGTLAFNRTDTVTLANLVSGTGSLRQIGTGTLILTANNTYSGTTVISAGTLQIGDGGTTGTLGTGAVTDNGTLTFNRSDSLIVSNAISGSGRLIQDGTGTTILTGNNTYSGTTTINTGTLQVGDGGTTGTLGTGTVNNSSVLAFNRSNTLVVGNTITGTGSLTQIGTGTTILTGTNTYSGDTLINAGTLQIGNGGTTGSLGTGAVINDSVLSFNRNNTLTVSNLISGTGSLTQAGSGTTVLAADNTYSGGTTISAGTLQIGNGGTTGWLGSGDITNNGTLAFNRSDSVTLDNIIAGSGNVSQLGAGTLILTATNTYSGTTTISNGTLQVGNGGTTGTLGTGGVVNNAALAFDRSDSVVVSNMITGAGSLTQAGTGTLILLADNDYRGGTVINAGTLQVGDGGTTGALGTGAVSVAGALVFNRTNDVIAANIISGVGSLTQAGAGTLTLTRTNTYSGGTWIRNGGTLIVRNNNAVGSGSLNVVNGTLQVGQQSLNVGGNYAQTADGTLVLTLATAAEYGQLNIAGTASLNGALQVLTTNGFVATHNTTLALIVAGGGVTGTFATFTNNLSSSPLLTPQLTYGATNVTLQWLQASFQPYATTPNQRAVAAALDSLVHSTAAVDVNLINTLDNLSSGTNGLAAAYDLIAPEELTAMFTLSFAGINNDIDRVLGRSSYLRAGYQTAYPKLLEQISKDSIVPEWVNRDVAAGQSLWSFYAEGDGGTLSLDEANTASGSDASSAGITVGIERRINSHLVAGLSGHYLSSSDDLTNGGSIDEQSIRGQLYGLWLKQGWHAEALIGGGRTSYDTKRTALGGTATGSTDGTEWYGMIGGGYDWQRANWFFGPEMSLRYASADIDAFTETGSASPLHIASQSADALYTQLGVRLGYRGYVQGSWTFVTPEVSLAWRHNYLDTELSLDAQSTSGAGNVFTVSGSDTGKDSFVAGLGLTVQWTPTFSTYLRYAAQVGSNGYENHSVNLGVGVNF